MARQMTIGKRISLGFAVVIVIALAIGALGVWNMLTAKNNSVKLATEYVPEVRVANQLRGAANRLMYDMRGYGYTESHKHYEAAQEELAAVNKHLQEASDLADRAVHLEALHGQVAQAQAAVNEYEGLMKQTQEIIAAMDGNRAKLDQNAVTYMENCEAFLAGQNEAFDRDLDERQRKVEIVTNIVDRGTRVRVANFKAQESGDMNLMRDALTDLGGLKEELAQLRPITRSAENVAQIDTIEAAANQYADAMEAYLKTNDALVSSGNKMDSNAAAYMENCTAFLNSQNERMNREFNTPGADLAERLRKITLVNDIIDAGNAARVMNFKAQANDEPGLMKEAMEKMLSASRMTDELRRITHQAANLEQIDTIKRAAETYAGAIKTFLEEYQVLDDINKEMDTAAGAYVANCEAFLKSQQQALSKDMHERHNKITLVNEIIDLGNAARVNAFKAQALREPALLGAALENFPKLDEKYNELRKITRLKEDLERIDKVQTSGNNYAKALTAFRGEWQKLVDLGAQRDETGNRVIDACKTTADAGMTNTDQIATEAAASLSSSSMIMAVGLGIGVLIAIFAALWITRGITKLLGRIIEGLNEGAEQVASASGQVSAASQSLAEGASEQAASIEETSSSLEEMSSMTKQNAENAGQANTLMDESKQIVRSANSSMTDMVSSMQQITKASEETSKIIKTIDEIAFQTNLLALNAAVEAARAGEAGAGFAVVADEVRNLAMRAAEAAKNTSNLIEDTTKKVQEGSSLVEKTSEEFGKVEESAMKVSELVGEIAAASREQSEGIDQVNQAVADMDKVTQQNAANAEESASSSEEMNAQAEQMKIMVDELVVLVGGSGKGGTSHRVQAGKGVRKRLSSPGNLYPQKGNHKAVSKSNHGEVTPEQAIPFDEDESFKEF